MSRKGGRDRRRGRGRGRGRDGRRSSGLHRELIQLDPGYIRILEGNGHSNLRLFGTAFRATLEMVRRRERDAQPQAAHAAVAAA